MKSEDRSALAVEFKGNALYLSVYVPVAVGTLAFLGLGLPYLLLGIKPVGVLRGASIIAWGAYIVACVPGAVFVASVVWLRLVRDFLTREQASKIMMPFGSNPMGRWLVERNVPGGKHGA